jgi:hypothetical protein
VLRVLLLLFVYLVVAGVGVFLAHRFVAPLSRRVRVLLILAPWLITGKAFFTGGVYAPLDIVYQAPPLSYLRSEVGVGATKTPSMGDVVYQEIPWRKAVREAVKHGRLPLWNRFILAGEPLLATQQPAVLHPFTWAGMLLPLAQAWTLEMTLGVFLALLAGFLFCRDLSLSELACAFGAVGWAFSDYLLFFAGYPLAPAAAAFPLLLLGLARIARNQDARAVGITTVALLLTIVAGHSETLLHAVGAAGLWFLCCLAGRKRAVRAVLLSVVAGAVALGLTAVVLLPHLEALPHTFEYFLRAGWYAHVQKSFPLLASFRRLQQIIVPYAFGISGHGDSLPGEYGISIAYIGAALWPFAVVGMTVRGRTKWVLLILGALGIGMWAGFPGVADLVGSLPLFDIALNERLIFLGCFALAALAALGAEELLQGRRARLFGLSALLLWCGLLLCILLLRPRMIELHMPPADLRLMALLQLLPLAAVAVVWLVRRRADPAPTLALLLCIVLLERGAEAASVYPAAPSRAFYPPLAFLDAIPRTAPWRTTAVGFTFIPNISAMYELEDVRGYEAMTFRPLFETYPLWCVAQPVWFNRIDDPTKPFLSFLNVRYVLTPPEYGTPSGWRTVSESSLGKVLENPAALPRAFVPLELQIEPEPADRLAALSRISDFRRNGIVAELPGWQPHDRVRNGRADVEITQYRPDRLNLRVHASTAAVVATSITSWPGWNLSVDGAPQKLLAYNHAFLGFTVQPGRHRVTLAYAPGSVTLGATIGLGTLLGLAAWVAVRRMRERGAATK